MSKLDKIIAGKAPGVACTFFDQVLWRDRATTLTELGFNAIPRSELHEVAKPQAEAHIASALAFDLCYGTRLFPKGDAAAIAADFTARLHWQTRFFVNTPHPMSGRFAGAFSPLSTEATMDTGVMTKSGECFSALLWVFSSD